MPSVFISYVKEDSQSVTRMASILDEHKVDVWVDRTSLKLGQWWEDEIRKGISECDFFIACFSEAYVRRTETYMNDELALAIEQVCQRPKDYAWFIPVKLSRCDIPGCAIGHGGTLRSIQWVDLYADWLKGMETILSAILGYEVLLM